MELESEFGVGLPEGEPGRLETIAELIDYLARKKFE
jgi:acyl carrier protein